MQGLIDLLDGEADTDRIGDIDCGMKDTARTPVVKIGVKSLVNMGAGAWTSFVLLQSEQLGTRFAGNTASSGNSDFDR